MKRYNTPHRSRVVKTRLTDEEYADFTARLAPYGMSQSEFIRQAITRATIRPIVTVSPVNDELLAAVGKLTAEYGRIGGNLNQIARYRDKERDRYRDRKRERVRTRTSRSRCLRQIQKCDFDRYGAFRTASRTARQVGVLH